MHTSAESLTGHACIWICAWHSVSSREMSVTFHLEHRAETEKGLKRDKHKENFSFLTHPSWLSCELIYITWWHVKWHEFTICAYLKVVYCWNCKFQLVTGRWWWCFVQFVLFLPKSSLLIFFFCFVLFLYVRRLLIDFEAVIFVCFSMGKEAHMLLNLSFYLHVWDCNSHSSNFVSTLAQLLTMALKTFNCLPFLCSFWCDMD